MNENNREESLDFHSSSRVSTNDSNEQDVTDDLTDITARSIGFDDVDLEHNRLHDIQDSENNNEIGLNQARNNPFESLKDMNLGQKIGSLILWSVYIVFLIVYHIFTTLIINFSIWIFVVMLMLFLIIKICLSYIFPNPSDISSMFGYRSPRRRRSTTNNRRNRPQSFNSRRLARDFDSIHFNNRIRNQQRRQQEQDLVEIQLQELQPSLPTSSSERTQTRRSNLRPATTQSIATIQREQNRRRRDIIRAELLRMIAANTYDNQRNLNSAILLRNLQMLQLSSLARDFNENDYEMLSSLDQHHRAFATEKQQFMIAQLPTYQFKDKQSPSKDQDEFKDNRQNSNEKLVVNERNQCSICIEQFVEDETIKILPCFHQFHSQCIDDWLLRKSLCPVCKYDIDVSSNELIEGDQLNIMV